MAKNRWNKYSRANKSVLSLLLDSTHLTTNAIKRRLAREKNLFLSHQTVNKYCEELRLAGHIDVMVFEKNNKVKVWKLKTV